MYPLLTTEDKLKYENEWLLFIQDKWNIPFDEKLLAQRTTELMSKFEIEKKRSANIDSKMGEQQ